VAASVALFDQVVVPGYFYGDFVVGWIDECGPDVFRTWPNCYLVTPHATADGRFSARDDTVAFVANNWGKGDAVLPAAGQDPNAESVGIVYQFGIVVGP
jgi:hypothetical protein